MLDGYTYTFACADEAITGTLDTRQCCHCAIVIPNLLDRTCQTDLCHWDVVSAMST